MWVAWTGTIWLEIGEEYVETARERGYEVRCIDTIVPSEVSKLRDSLGEYNPDPQVLPLYVEQGLADMAHYMCVF